jgi:hypothetical protein
MATRAEQYRADAQRRNGKGKKKKLRPGRSKPGAPPGSRSRASKHAARKATYALETSPRRSRKSTRKSANRAKPDTAFNVREEMTKGSPEMRAAKARARATRPRGGGR